jgi:hypothetical protein
MATATVVVAHRWPAQTARVPIPSATEFVITAMELKSRIAIALLQRRQFAWEFIPLVAISITAMLATTIVLATP